MSLDDASPLVRQAMAEVFAGSADAPPAIVAALSVDQPSVASPILEFSPLLVDADLVDIVATGHADTQCAIARRTELPPSVCAAIAEVGHPSAALELIENPLAALASFSLDRIVERHGHLAAIRESLLTRDDLSPATRLALAERLSSTLANFVTARQWLAPDRAQRVTHEALERSTVNIAAQSRGEGMTALIKHLRAAGHLNAGLILRALLSGNMDLFEESLVELSGLSRSRVAGILHDRGSVSLNALLTRAGLPESTFKAFRAALDASEEVGFTGTVDGATRLRRSMVERVLTQCANEPTGSAQSLMILLRRFATESAREEARLFCDELAGEEFAEAEYYDDEMAEHELDDAELPLIASPALQPYEEFYDDEDVAYAAYDEEDPQTLSLDDADDIETFDGRIEPRFDDAFGNDFTQWNDPRNDYRQVAA